jgi:hypothetical protein
LQDVDVSSWAELCDRVFHYRKDGHWIFRGEKQPDRLLRPRIGRPESRKDIGTGDTKPFDPQQEALMIDYFIRAAPPHIKHIPRSRLEWLAIAQHHGMATRLLDWTESLFVAAYFAVEGAVGTKVTPVIYAVKNLPVSDRALYDKIDELQDGSLYYPPHISPNIPAQRSVFSVHRQPDKTFEPTNMERLVLRYIGPRTAPITYRLNLDACGVNVASLFPDVNGLAHYVSWIYKWGRLPPSL